ncbi:MAG: hypothetical protein HY644_09130 [Acidobacteria bacterium]|nr:hypothetical protein [Acidobacteriota bacterium]
MDNPSLPARRFQKRFVLPPTLATLVLAYLSSPVCFARNIYFAQVADGGGFSTTFVLANMGSSTAIGTLNFFNPDGSPRTLRINGTERSQFAVTIPSGGSVRLRSENVGDALAGWAMLESADQIDGVATFDLRGPAGSLMTTAAVLGGKGYKLVAVPVETSSSTNTGVAIANISRSSSVAIKLRLLDEAGIEVAAILEPRLSPLGSQRQIADFADALFRSVAGISNFRGSLIVEVVDAGEVSVTGLVIKEGLLSALPVIELSALPVAPAPSPDDPYGY